MNAISKTDSDVQTAIVVDAHQAQAPVNIIMLQSAMNAAPKDQELFVLKSSDPQGELNLRSFCTRTGHHFLRTQTDGGETQYFIRNAKSTHCAACANVRNVLAGVATIATLALTAPYIFAGAAPFIATAAFLLALCALPSVACNNAALFIKTCKKLAVRKVASSNPV